MGIIFSVDEYNVKLSPRERKVIDDFFDSLSWKNVTADSSPIVPEITYGDLMMMVDMENRWVYRGSVTTPPCSTQVYWNVLRTIYPIRQKHLDQFRSILSLGKNDLAKSGNWRLIQKIDDHDLMVIENVLPEDSY